MGVGDAILERETENKVAKTGFYQIRRVPVAIGIRRNNGASNE